MPSLSCDKRCRMTPGLPWWGPCPVWAVTRGAGWHLGYLGEVHAQFELWQEVQDDTMITLVRSMPSLCCDKRCRMTPWLLWWGPCPVWAVTRGVGWQPGYLGEVHAQFELWQEVQDDTLVLLHGPQLWVLVQCCVLLLLFMVDMSCHQQSTQCPASTRVRK